MRFRDLRRLLPIAAVSTRSRRAPRVEPELEGCGGRGLARSARPQAPRCRPESILGGVGQGFRLAQARLVPELVAMKWRSALLLDLPELTTLCRTRGWWWGDADTLVYPVETSLAGAETEVPCGVLETCRVQEGELHHDTPCSSRTDFPRRH